MCYKQGVPMELEAFYLKPHRGILFIVEKIEK